MTLTTVNAGMLDTQAQYNGFKNRLINSAMVIDQRNAGAAVTATSGYTLDRWNIRESGAGTASFQQVSDAPSGFSYSLKTTVTGTVSPLTASDRLLVRQSIEGFNTADLSFGTASATTITISFWVKASVSGQFGGAISNSALNRSYVFNFTVSSADTWEYKTVTVVGDTTGTWVGATNGVGLHLTISMATGSTYITTANAWQAGDYLNTSSSVNLMATSGATFYITGVQLEKGSTATSFDYRPYGTELALCQRYLPATFNRVGNDPIAVVQCISSTIGIATIPFPVTPRVNPTGITTTTVSNFYVTNTISTAGFNASAMTFELTSNLVGQIRVTYANNAASAGNIVALYSNTSGAQILWTGCEL
jgi:hypothetical protein